MGADRSKPSALSDAERRELTREQLFERLGAWEAWASLDNQAASLHNQKRGAKPFRMEKYSQRMIALRIAYDGWNFDGFATQPAFSNTVEDRLFQALMKTRLIVSRETADYSRGGRTDKGVSALANVIGIRVRSNGKGDDEEIDYVHTLNGVLPVGLRVTGWSPAPDRGGPNGNPFSARFDASYRSYKYFFPKGDLDVSKMNKAASSFVGRHDFRNFCKVDPSQRNRNFERLIYSAEVCRASQPPGSWSAIPGTTPDSIDSQYTLYEFRVCGQAFMWHQIRCMAAVLFRVGQGLEEPSTVADMLDQASSVFGLQLGKPCYRMAPETPLVLCECAYPPNLLNFRSSERATRRMDRECVESWAVLACRGSIVRENLGLNELIQLSQLPENIASFLKYRAIGVASEDHNDKRDTQLAKRSREAVVGSKGPLMPKKQKVGVSN